MLNLRCPDCWFSTPVDNNAPHDALCKKCGANLYTYYFEGRTTEETIALAEAKNEAFRNRSRSEIPTVEEVGGAEQARKISEEEPLNMEEERSRTGRRWPLLIGAILFGLMGYGYLSTKTLAIDLANSILRDNGRSQTRVTGVSLPISVMWNTRATASLFLQPPRTQGAPLQTLNPNMRDDMRIEVEVVSSGIPIVGLAFSDLYMEIPGHQLMLVPFDH